MTYFQNNKWAYWTIAILVVLNLFTIGMLLMQKERMPMRGSNEHSERHDKREGDKRTNHLGLNDDQMKQFKGFKMAHREKVKTFLGAIKETKTRKLEVLTTTPLNQMLLDSLDQVIGNVHVQMEVALNQHYKDLSAICNDEQKEKLKERFKKVFQRDHNSKRRKREH